MNRQRQLAVMVVAVEDSTLPSYPRRLHLFRDLEDRKTYRRFYRLGRRAWRGADQDLQSLSWRPAWLASQEGARA